MNGTELPEIKTALPGPQSRYWVDHLARTECPAITARRDRRAKALGTENDDPIVWDTAVGANVTDMDGNRYVDLTSGFGVALMGHRHPAVVHAVRDQSEKLLHAMGDAWPDAARIRFLDAFSKYTPDGLDISILGLSGSDAIDATIKTAILKTKKSGVLTFDGGYHGLSLGVLGLQGYKSAFTTPFQNITHPEVYRLPFGASPADITKMLSTHAIGLVLVEPIQGRGGMRPCEDGWLAEVAALARSHGALFALDEIQSGMGRTGVPFAGVRHGVIPDVLCVGKAIAGGFPLSACVGTEEAMSGWGQSTGEAIHTQTFLGHPIGCAAGSAVLHAQTPEFFASLNNTATYLRTQLEQLGFEVRGEGLMLGVHTPKNRLEVARELMRHGYLILPAGMDGEVLGLTPPACLTPQQIDGFVTTLHSISPPLRGSW